MGLPRDLLSHGTCADFTLAPHSTRGVHTPYAPIQRMVWFRTGSARRYRQIFWEMWYLLQGLESEGMGLPRDVSSGATAVGLTAAQHCTLDHSHHLCHTPTMHGGVKADVRSGRWGGCLASSSWGDVPPSPLPCSWSHRRYLAVFMSLYTHNPYILWVTH